MLVNSHDDEKLKQRLWFPNGGVWWKNVSSQVQLDIIDGVQTELFSTITLKTKYRKVGLVHALTYPFYSWREFCEKLETDSIIQQWALWQRDFEALNQKKVAGIDLVVCGHTPMDKPFSFSNFVNIDTGCGHPVSQWLAEPALTIIELSEALSFHRFA